MFFTILVATAAPHFFCTFASLNSISEPNNTVCVLGAINERCQVLRVVRMYVSYNNFITVFFLSLKTSNIGMLGVYPEAMD